MRHALQPHPETPCNAVSAITVDIARVEGALRLGYRLEGDLRRMAIPALGQPSRTDELWRGTCFEAFLQAEGGPGYRELNFSPSTQWAAYDFTGYREGMQPALAIEPQVTVAVGSDRLELEALVPDDGARLLIGLACVIQEAGGATSYWALAHLPGRPDFHHMAGFALELPANGRP